MWHQLGRSSGHQSSTVRQQRPTPAIRSGASSRHLQSRISCWLRPRCVHVHECVVLFGHMHIYIYIPYTGDGCDLQARRMSAGIGKRWRSSATALTVKDVDWTTATYNLTLAPTRGDAITSTPIKCGSSTRAAISETRRSASMAQRRASCITVLLRLLSRTQGNEQLETAAPHDLKPGC
jgi:hypothetical protein